MKKKINVKQIVDKKLCTGCGGCKAVCPINIIDMKVDKHGICTPKVIHEKCIDCGLCLKVCPGGEFDYLHYMNKIHGGIPKNVAIGPVVDAYAAATTDNEIHKISQSGGFVSTLLIYGLENNLFDGVVVTGWSSDDPTVPKVYIARTKEEVLDSVGSKYNSVPVASIASEISKLEGKFAFVGTSCQIHAMRKIEENTNLINDKISIYIGLHCYKVFNYHIFDYIFHKSKIRKDKIRSFKYRDKIPRGWPGDISLKFKNLSKVSLDKNRYRITPKPYYSNWRCQLCFDKFNEFSDISCGDCRIPKHYNAKTMEQVNFKSLGKSDIVVRTARGKIIMDNLIKENKIDIEDAEINDMIRSVGPAEKKLGVNYNSDFIRKIGGYAPNYGIKFLMNDPDKPNKQTNKQIRHENFSRLIAINYYLSHSLNKYKLFRAILKRTPSKILYYLTRLTEGRSVQVKNRHVDKLFIKKIEKETER